MKLFRAAWFVWSCTWGTAVEAFVEEVPRTIRFAALTSSSLRSTPDLYSSISEGVDDASKPSWSVTDDWTSLSEAGSTVNSDAVFHHETSHSTPDTAPLSEDDVWIRDVVDEIHNAFSTLHEDPPLYDTSFDEPEISVSENGLESDMEREIAMLIRCNEEPESMLLADGKALAPLGKHEKNNVSQLVVFDEEKNGFKATDFLTNAVTNIFRQHAVPSVFDGVLSLDRAGIASWMTTALESEEEGKVSPHDRRVLKTLSDYSSYGSGRIILDELQELYFSTIIGNTNNLSKVSPNRHLALRQPFIDAVWRDIRAHGMLSPVEEERLLLEEEIRVKNEETRSNFPPTYSKDQIVDECEILEWNGGDAFVESDAKTTKRRVSSKGLSSHKLLELADDKKTPLRMRDGEFVFIDEESCIGCKQCTNVSPSSFVMLDSGRARTFHQHSGSDVDQAVLSCPVSCMHHVSYKELKEYETARDEGDGRTDHNHLGHKRGHTPLHVAGIASDNNHRSSWYHMLKHKCLMSSDCPRNGCYACPKYSSPGENPFFKMKHKQAEHVRAQHFIRHGEVDAFRKAAEL